MWRSLNNLAKRESGVAAVEMALIMPFAILLVVGIIEFGRVIEQTNAVEKGLASAAMFVARASYPLTAAETTSAENLAKYGNKAGTGGYLVSGWGEAGADLSMTPRSVTVGTNTVYVYTLTATVPFDPILPGLTAWLGFDNFNIEATLEQAYIGN
jgi:Flp pilus assembly protein TadG